jgi:hypothetical protein
LRPFGGQLSDAFDRLDRLVLRDHPLLHEQMDKALAQHQSDIALELRRLHDRLSGRNGKVVIVPQVTTANLVIYARNLRSTGPATSQTKISGRVATALLADQRGQVIAQPVDGAERRDCSSEAC